MTIFGIPLHTFLFGFMGGLIGTEISRLYIRPRLWRKTK